jgi:hypothetical protein
MTLPPPPLWPTRSAEEYRRDKSPPWVLVALGVLVMFSMTLVAVGYFMHGDEFKGLVVIIGVVALWIGIWYIGSAMQRKWG